MKDNGKKFKKAKVILLSLIFFVIVLCVGFYIYTLDYYRATSDVISIDKRSNVKRVDNIVVFSPANGAGDKAGIIFYPGGKVEAFAYAPLLTKLADKGYTCVLVEMPFNLAVFSINGADKIYEKLPEIKSWYLMGHSLGGAMASSYSEKNYEKLRGLILLGAYPLNDADIPTITIYGTEDLSDNMDELQNKYDAVLIEGGNHAYFGNYGEQKGDGIATMTRDEQQDTTVEIIVKFINKN